MTNLMRLVAQRENRAVNKDWETDFDAEFERAMVGIDYNREPLDQIVERTALAAGLTSKQIMGDRTIKIYARARNFAMWKARKAGYSIMELADYFNRDHSSITRACQKIGGLMANE